MVLGFLLGFQHCMGYKKIIRSKWPAKHLGRLSHTLRYINRVYKILDWVVADITLGTAQQEQDSSIRVNKDCIAYLATEDLRSSYMC
jgi:hypothetical protein